MNLQSRILQLEELVVLSHKRRLVPIEKGGEVPEVRIWRDRIKAASQAVSGAFAQMFTRPFISINPCEV